MHRLKTIQKQIREIEPDAKDDSDSFQTAVVVLSSASNELKTAEELAKFTGYPTAFIRPILANLKMNGLGWRKDGKFHHSGWKDKDCGGLNFTLDVMVGRGLLQTSYSAREEKKCKQPRA